MIITLAGRGPWLSSQVITYQITPLSKVEYNSLKEGFQAMPDEYKIRNFWFWLKGVATKESITQDLEAMKQNGYGGALIGDNGAPIGPTGPTFMGNEWLDLYAHAVKEADRLGIELSINIQSGFGDPGNPNIRPDNGMKKIVHSEIKVTGPKRFRAKLPMPPSQVFYQDIAVQAFNNDYMNPADSTGIKNWLIKSLNKRVPWSSEKDRLDMMINYDDYPVGTDYASINPDQIHELTENFADSILTWEVPPGEWTIIRYGMTSTGKRNEYASPGYMGGLCYDQINRRGIEAHWKDVALPLLEIARKSGNSLKFVHTDSWEMGMTNWTHDFMKEFKKLRGYDISSYLPALTNKIVGSPELTNRFLEDFRLTIGEMVAGNNYTVLRDLAHASGVLLHSEAAGPAGAPVDGLQTLGINDIPFGEFWPKETGHRMTDGQRFSVKQASCAAHIYGKRFVAAEGPTTIGPAWERTPRDLKHDFDRAFCNGVNRIFWHTYTSSPDEYGIPGIEYFAGTHLSRKVTWWDQSVSFIKYINRSQFLLSQGLYCADILGYYGTGVPRYVFLENDIKDVPDGYSWDMCNSEVLLSRAAVKNGRIVLPDGMNYRLLVLGDQKDISPDVLKKIEQMVKEGIILVGPPPERASGLSGYPASDQEVKEIVARLWGNIDQESTFINIYGKGRVYSGKTVGEVLNMEKISPDFFWKADSDVGLWYIHRSTDEAEIYFIMNKWARHGINDFQYRYLTGIPDRYVKALCSFRVEGEREIERWDPVTGDMTPVVVFKNHDGRYEIPVTLTPEGSAFFVFRKSPLKRHLISIKKDGESEICGNTPLVVGSSGTFIQSSYAEVMEKGKYQLTCSDGKEIIVNAKKIPEEIMINGPWRVRFMEKSELGTPIDMEIDTLKSWTEFQQNEIKYFSGTARYEKTFELSGKHMKNGRVYIDLGNVQELATIRINGKEVSTCWISPYRADITEFAVTGKNLLEIDVTNLWVNRLIGDGRLPKEERRTRTNITKFDAPEAEKYLRLSGLLGPVKIQFSYMQGIEL